MDRRTKVELFEQIRREYTHGAGTIQGAARKLGVHRRMVRQALASSVPPERKPAVRRKPSLGPVIEFIDAILMADEQAPRKQRHTARRIWRRIREERSEASVGEATVRRYVRQRKGELGQPRRETFIPQLYEWGGEAQVDWYAALHARGLDQIEAVFPQPAQRFFVGGLFNLDCHFAGFGPFCLPCAVRCKFFGEGSAEHAPNLFYNRSIARWSLNSWFT